MVDKQSYEVFEIDLKARSTLISEPIQAKSRALAACA